jgi:hypothetical protein
MKFLYKLFNRMSATNDIKPEPDNPVNCNPEPPPPQKLNDCGEWRGDNRGLEQRVKVMQFGHLVVAVKLADTDYVPTGQISWLADMRTKVGDEVAGQGQISELHFDKPQFVPGTLKIVGQDRLLFTWKGNGQVEYRRDDI